MVDLSPHERASFGRRCAAYALDAAFMYLPALLALLVPFVLYFFGPATFGFRDEAVGSGPFIVLLAFSGSLILASFVWWLSVLGRGITPGKQLVGIRVIQSDGHPLTWTRMLLREIVSKAPLAAYVAPQLGIFAIPFLFEAPFMGSFLDKAFSVLPDILSFVGLSEYVFALLLLVDNLWALSNRNGQALHDKVMSTYVVRVRSGQVLGFRGPVEGDLSDNEPKIPAGQSLPELASFLRRSAAFSIDAMLFLVPMSAIWVTWVIAAASSLGDCLGPGGVGPCNDYKVYWTWVMTVGPLTMCIGAVWSLFTLRNGQTPGKQLVGIQVVRGSGEPASWKYTFVREALVKGLLLYALALATNGIVLLVNYLWAAFDRHNQTVHDKIMGSLVVRVRK